MKCVYIVIVFFYIPYTTSQFVSINHKQQKSPCNSSTKNSLIEHFFNVIFSEFQTTPPVCVCVQMCAGQSTYCYPNGCLKKDDMKRVDSPQTAPQARGDRKQYMFVVDEKNDFMKDFLEKSYVDETKTVAPVEEPIQDTRPELFKDKYNILVKYKKMPSVELRYNLREQLKSTKPDFIKIDSVDLSKTRWPMNKQNLVSGHRVHSTIGKRTPIIGKSNFFMSMLPANDVAEYPPKYFKRDITKTLNDDEVNAKGFYLFEKPDSTDTNETFSLETLIGNLINNSFRTKLYDKNNETHYAPKVNETAVNKTEVIFERTTLNPNATMNKSIEVLSVNFTNQQEMYEEKKNEYKGDSEPSSTNKFNEMIVNLSKRIEKQNNTSMKIAKLFVGDFDDEDTGLTNTEAYNSNLNSSVTDNAIQNEETETVNQETTTITSTDFKDTMVTKKNRQKRARKLQISKSNAQ